MPHEVQVVAERYCKKRDTTQVYFKGERKLMHFTVEIIATYYESSKPLKFWGYNMVLKS